MLRLKVFVILNTIIEDRASIGPFARLRDRQKLTKKKIGNFVEIKNLILKQMLKSHLSYIGDAVLKKF